MSLRGGCCCGIIAGIFLVVATAVIGTVAVYCWMNPEARKAGVKAIARCWEKVKDSGDEIIDEVKEIDSKKIPEPKIDFKLGD